MGDAAREREGRATHRPSASLPPPRLPSSVLAYLNRADSWAGVSSDFSSPVATLPDTSASRLRALILMGNESVFNLSERRVADPFSFQSLKRSLTSTRC